MNSLNIQTSIALGAFLLALFTNIIGVIAWALIAYAGAEKKKYAAERDFNHLKNNQLQISNGIGVIAKDIDNYFDKLDTRLNSHDQDLLEIKTYLNIHYKHE
jgi:hypothetical protein